MAEDIDKKQQAEQPVDSTETEVLDAEAVDTGDMVDAGEDAGYLASPEPRVTVPIGPALNKIGSAFWGSPETSKPKPNPNKGIDDLFVGPKETDDDMYVDDLFELDDDGSVDIGGDDMSDLFEVPDDVTKLNYEEDVSDLLDIPDDILEVDEDRDSDGFADLVEVPEDLVDVPEDLVGLEDEDMDGTADIVEVPDSAVGLEDENMNGEADVLEVPESVVGLEDQDADGVADVVQPGEDEDGNGEYDNLEVPESLTSVDEDLVDPGISDQELDDLTSIPDDLLEVTKDDIWYGGHVSRPKREYKIKGHRIISPNSDLSSVGGVR